MTTRRADARIGSSRAPGALRVGIVGAGIGGLTAAVSLLQAGIDVHVYEQASTLGVVGAGVQLSPNATRILHRLGLADDLTRSGVKPLAWRQRRWDDGRTLLRTPLADVLEVVFEYPYYQIHRADLLFALAAAVPVGRIHLGHRLIGLVEHADRVEARFADGVRAEFDVLVGADGIHSGVRHELFGAQRPRFAGCAAYRGLVSAERVRDLNLETTAQLWMGPGRHFVHYFVRAGRLVNFVAVVEKDGWKHESWTDRVDPAQVRMAFEGWHRQVQGILAAADDAFVWALFDRPPLGHWSTGRVTLLGDACHPMVPFMAQGAAQAIEDAAALAACLVRGPLDVGAALHHYEQLRIPRTALLQAMSARNKVRLHLPDGQAQRDRDARMASGTTDWSFRAIDWIYKHDAGVVDDGPAGAAARWVG